MTLDTPTVTVGLFIVSHLIWSIRWGTRIETKIEALDRKVCDICDKSVPRVENLETRVARMEAICKERHGSRAFISDDYGQE